MPRQLDTAETISARIAAGLRELPEDLAGELRGMVELFQRRLDLLEGEALRRGEHHDGSEYFAPGAGERRTRIRAALHTILKEDLVYFLLKVLAGRYEPPPGLPPVPNFRHHALDILKELKVYAYHPAAKDFSHASIPERWYVNLARNQKSPCTPEKLLQYLALYRNRLYSLSTGENERPYLFANYASFVRHFIGAESDEETLTFEEIYRAELQLRREIEAALLLRTSIDQSLGGRSGVMLAREIVAERSDRFITDLHNEFENYYRKELRRRYRAHSKVLREKEHLDAEMREAARLHNKALQKDLPGDDQRVRFEVWYEPYVGLGGDFYRVDRISDDVYSLFLCDIAGHGLSAALHFHPVVNAFERQAKEYLEAPEVLLKRMNDDLYGQLRDNFVTAIHAVVDLKRGEVDYCNAGHPKGFIAALGSPGQRVRFLRPNSKVLGCFPRVEFRRDVVELYDASRLALYTDGISEAMDVDYNMLGERGLLDLFEGTLHWDTRRTLDHVRESLNEFKGRRKTEDDRSLLITDITLNNTH